MNDGTGMDNMTAVIVKLRPTFDGNKAAENLEKSAHKEAENIKKQYDDER